MGNKRHDPDWGFTLLEMVAVVTILVILAGVVIPIANGLIEDGKVARALDTVEKTASACRRYFAETGKAPQSLGDLWVAPASGVEGWNGPYLDRPIEDSDNPFGGGIGQSLLAYDFELALTLGTTTKGISLDMGKVPMTAVAKIEAALDQQDNPAKGRVEYAPDALNEKADVRFFLMPSSP